MSSRAKLKTFFLTTAALESPSSFAKATADMLGEDGEGIFRQRNFDNKDRKWMKILN
ncbi:MAG: hypothetical protein ACPGSB_03610 [Opitutales bacterium]